MINYNNLDLAADATTRGGGKFYNLYGTSATAGAEAAWAWGASRILDALEITPRTERRGGRQSRHAKHQLALPGL